MDWLIWSGSGLAVIGLIGLVYCIVTAMRAKRANLPNEEMRSRLQRVVAINMAALLISALGLMCVVTGIILS